MARVYGERVAEGWRGARWDGKRRRTEEGGGQRGEREMCAVGAGGCRRTALVECERERAGIAGGGRGGGGGRGRGGGGGGGFGATVMSVCTRTPSRPRRWRNVATQPHRKRKPHRAAPSFLVAGQTRRESAARKWGRCVGHRESRLYDQRRRDVDVDGDDDDVRCVHARFRYPRCCCEVCICDSATVRHGRLVYEDETRASNLWFFTRVERSSEREIWWLLRSKRVSFRVTNELLVDCQRALFSFSHNNLRIAVLMIINIHEFL